MEACFCYLNLMCLLDGCVVDIIQTFQPREKVQKDKQRSTKNTYKTKDRVTRTLLKTGGELR